MGRNEFEDETESGDNECHAFHEDAWMNVLYVSQIVFIAGLLQAGV